MITPNVEAYTAKLELHRHQIAKIDVSPRKDATGTTTRTGRISNGQRQGLLQYMMLEKNTHEKLANANALAIKGLQPKITVWNTGDGASSSSDGTGAIRNIMQSLPPLFSTINEQTGMSPPSWLAQIGNSQALEKGKPNTPYGNGEVNGH